MGVGGDQGPGPLQLRDRNSVAMESFVVPEVDTEGGSLSPVLLAPAPGRGTKSLPDVDSS